MEVLKELKSGIGNKSRYVAIAVNRKVIIDLLEVNEKQNEVIKNLTELVGKLQPKDDKEALIERQKQIVELTSQANTQSEVIDKQSKELIEFAKKITKLENTTKGLKTDLAKKENKKKAKK